MKSTSLLAIAASCLLLGIAPVVLSQDDSEQISIEEIRRMCAQWAEEDGLEEDEKPEYIESCIRDEAAAVGIEISGSSED
jgi:hypothetical protein